MKLSCQIQARSASQSRLVKNEDAFHKTFPHFIWLLRDVMVDVPDDCKDIKEYFLTRVRMAFLDFLYPVATISKLIVNTAISFINLGTSPLKVLKMPLLY